MASKRRGLNPERTGGSQGAPPGKVSTKPARAVALSVPAADVARLVAETRTLRPVVVKRLQAAIPVLVSHVEQALRRETAELLKADAQEKLALAAALEAPQPEQATTAD